MKLLRVVVFSLGCFLLGRLHVGAIGGPDIVIDLPPISQSVAHGDDVTFTVVAVALGYLEYEWLHGGKPIPGATNATLTLHNVQLRDAGAYVACVIKGSRRVQSAPARLTVDGLAVEDLIGPTLAVEEPASLSDKTTNAEYQVRGTAGDNAAGVAELFYQHDHAGWLQTPASFHWQFLVPLHAGTNWLALKATDRVGNESATIKLAVFYSVTEPFSLAIDGAGHVVGPQAGELLEIGRSYQMRAVPTVGSYLKEWVVNGQTYTNSTLNIFITSNLNVRAEFRTNSLIAAQGNYVGLFYDLNEPAHESAGLLTCRVATTGKVTGRLLRGGQTLSFAGQFGYDLSAALIIARPVRQAQGEPAPTPPIKIELRLSPGSDRLTGWIGDGARGGSLEGYRSRFHALTNPATLYAGRFALASSGSTDAAQSPLGHSYGLCTVSTAGKVSFKGRLADGSTVSASVPLAANGQWPLYLPLYQGKGSLFGWVTLAETSTNDVHGLLQWTRAGDGAKAFYPGGYTNQITLIGSRYALPTSGSVLDLSNAVVSLAGGNLTVPLETDVWVGLDNKITVLATNQLRLALRLSPASGLLTGSFLHPETSRSSTIQGIVLQKQQAVSGWFLGTNEGGSFLLGAPGRPLWFDLTP